MSDPAPARVTDTAPPRTADREYDELRALILGPERVSLARLRARVESASQRTEDVSEVLPAALAAAGARDRQLRRALQPLVEEAIASSVERNPRVLTDAIFPLIGAAIRKAVAAALASLTDSLDQTLERSASWRGLAWRVEAWRTGRTFGEVVLARSALYRVEQVFLIHRKTGLVLGHQVAPGAVVKDASMVSAMLTAIEDFVRDSFGGEASSQLETMRVGEFSVWIQPGPRAVLAGVVRGVAPPELRGAFERTLEEAHRWFGRELAAFDGDAEPFAPFQPLLAHCLLGRAPARRRPAVLRWVLAFALLAAILAGGWYWVRDSLRWNRYLERLGAQPGIVVLRGAHPWPGRYRVEGLRDPIAADPAALLADGTNLDPRRVDSHWEPYYSMVPAFAAARRLDAARERLERFALSFELGRAEPQPGALESLAGEIRTLAEAARAAGRPVRVEIRGYTDAAGSAALNTSLARQRAQAVVRELLARGIPESLLALPLNGEAGSHARSRSAMFRVVRQ